MNVSLSSKIIESILLGIRIPYILMCDKYLCDSVVTEVVDGQQRLLSILGLFESPFMNENNELEYSNKNGYYLRNLRILSEYNGCSFTKKRKGKIIPLCCVNKIQNSYLYIYRAKDMGDNSFSTIDYFVRLNKKASLIKENTYKMFYLTCDRKIIEHVIKNTSEFLGNLLPKENSSGKPYLVTLRLSYLFYNKLENEINYSNYSNLKVGSWLNEFNKFKDKNIYINVDEIQKLRLKYFKAINDTKDFYIKLNKFLNKMNKSIRDLVGMNNFSYVPLSYYYYLFCLLVNISESDLLENSLNIYNIVSSFFSKIRSEGSIDIDIESILNFSIRQVYIYDTKRRLEFNNKLSLSLEKI